MLRATAEPPAARGIGDAPQRGDERQMLWDLQNLRAAARLCEWMYERYAPFVHGEVVEIGAGLLDTALRAYDMLVPLWSGLERRRRPPWGLSLIAHARKPV